MHTSYCSLWKKVCLQHTSNRLCGKIMTRAHESFLVLWKSDDSSTSRSSWSGNASTRTPSMFVVFSTTARVHSFRPVMTRPVCDSAFRGTLRLSTLPHQHEMLRQVRTEDTAYRAAMAVRHFFFSFEFFQSGRRTEPRTMTSSHQPDRFVPCTLLLSPFGIFGRHHCFARLAMTCTTKSKLQQDSETYRRLSSAHRAPGISYSSRRGCVRIITTRYRSRHFALLHMSTNSGRRKLPASTKTDRLS